MKLIRYISRYSSVFFIAALLFSSIPVASASTAPVCIVLTSNLYRGTSGSSVVSLQNFLSAQGYFDYNVTGYFGPITFVSVQRFQSDNAISTTGYVGPLTRGAIQSLSCGGTPPPISSIYLRSLSPNYGPTGTTVTISGSGFTSANTILFDGSAVANNVPISSSIAIACTTDPSCRGGIVQTLVFTVPSSIGPNCPVGLMIACPMYVRLVTPGQYTVSVQNSNGTSGSLPFTVTANNNTGNPLSITGIDAPSTLATGQTGTWSVHVSDATAAGNLHYSVVWGDEATSPYPLTYSSAQVAQSSATFTHAYERAGVYTPTFTVTDDSGESATVSNTITVISTQ